MSKPIIEVQNLSKRFIIGHQKQERYTALRDVIAHNVKGIFRRTRELFSGNYITEGDTEEEFWALKGLNFSISRGDRVGIIGRNGAGKSTLLKILSRISEPTQGKITIRGRVASLLEVGTGFHPELSGRENIFLNGAILGMGRSEIRKKFDEIVAFAEVERFLDTPVKRYSSGMYVRLAFSVAAHLEPEILIVDEVLAVGDAQFQKKCLGKMEDVSNKEGRTVLFVSHNMGVVSALCNNTIILKDGQLFNAGRTDKMISEYMRMGEGFSGETIDNSPAKPGQKLKIRKVRILDENGVLSSEVNNACKAFIEVCFEVLIEGKGYDLGVDLVHAHYGNILCTALKDINPQLNDNAILKKGLHTYRIELPMHYLRGGDYLVTVASAIPKFEILDTYKYETQFSILDSISPIAKTTEGRKGAILPVLPWKNVSNLNSTLEKN